MADAATAGLAVVAITSVTVAAAGCGNASPREQFETEVLPLLEGHCLSTTCHGVGLDSEARGETVDWSYFHVRVRDDLRVVDVEQAYQAAKQRINTVESSAFSSLVRKPLSPRAGGVVHRGGAQFDRLDDRELQILLRWIDAEDQGGEGEALESLSAGEQLFASDVLPHLVAGQCLSQACHGPFSPFTSFAQPMTIEGAAQFATADVKKNYRSARVHLFLGGSPLQSRLIRKAVPLDRGGIVHRGGNEIFFATELTTEQDLGSDAAVAAIARWADLERETALSGPEPAISGVVYVRGPARAQRPFAHDSFVAGSDLFVLSPADNTGVRRNLTGAIHPAGPADIRDPAVRHDGQRIVFAMRRSVQDALNIYEIDVDGGNLQQLTTDLRELPKGGIAINAQPTYGPDGRVYFVSTRAGQLADGQDQLDTDIWAIDPSTRALERMTYEPSPSATPSFIGVGKSYGTLSFTMRRTLGGRYEAPVFRVPLDHNKAYHGDSELHIHHGVTIPEDIVYDMRALPDGRFACVLLNRDNLWRGGRLAIFDRQLGPELPVGQEDEAGLGGFRHAFADLDPSVGAGGLSPGGFYRHPVPLPDGRLLVTRASGPIDLDAADATVEMGLYIVSLDEGGGSDGGPALGASELLVDELGFAEYDAEPIVARPLEDDPSHELGWDPDAATATLAFRHVRVLSALFANLEPRGLKILRDDLAYARLLEAVPTHPLQATTPIGDSDHGRVRILAEIPLAGDSIYLQVPANTPFRVQFLNDDFMAVGPQQNRWIDAAPGEVFPGGVSPVLYPTLCAGCHGSISGLPGDVGGQVADVITAASVTLATHQNLDPRRPLAPGIISSVPFALDYQSDIAPLVSGACAVNGCHLAPTLAGGLDLGSTPTASFDSAYEALLQRGSGSGGGRAYVDAPGASAYTSHLMERLLGRELGATRDLSGDCGGSTALSPAEQRTFIQWIDSGAAYRGSQW